MNPFTVHLRALPALRWGPTWGYVILHTIFLLMVFKFPDGRGCHLSKNVVLVNILWGIKGRQFKYATSWCEWSLILNDSHVTLYEGRSCMNRCGLQYWFYVVIKPLLKTTWYNKELAYNISTGRSHRGCFDCCFDQNIWNNPFQCRCIPVLQRNSLAPGNVHVFRNLKHGSIINILVYQKYPLCAPAVHCVQPGAHYCEYFNTH